MLFLILLAFLTYVTYHLYRYFSPAPNINPSGKYVLISGCDSGFGTLLAIELDHQGFNVFAGVLNPSNVAELETKLSSRAKIFRLDITNDDDIDAALELVKHNTNTLHALVNNAGIGASGNVDWTSMETMRKVMNVNFFGHVAMTKKFLPLLIAKKDCRVVNICSVAGFFAASGLSAYCASKYALESFSDCLRREMVTWNLRVSIIEPGFMRTPIIQGRAKSFKEFWSKLNVDVQERWGEEFLNEQFVISSENIFIKKAEDPMKVVRALQHAVSNTEPCVRYRPGLQSSLFFYPLSMLPAWFADWFMQKSVHRKLSPAGVARQLQD